jgi:hypothetical protein
LRGGLGGGTPGSHRELQEEADMTCTHKSAARHSLTKTHTKVPQSVAATLAALEFARRAGRIAPLMRSV